MKLQTSLYRANKKKNYNKIIRILARQSRKGNKGLIPNPSLLAQGQLVASRKSRESYQPAPEMNDEQHPYLLEVSFAYRAFIFFLTSSLLFFLSFCPSFNKKL